MTRVPRIGSALRYIARGVVILAFTYVVGQLGLLDEGLWFLVPLGAVLVMVLRDLYFIDELEEEEPARTKL